jgi:hypothetical protein
MLEPLLHFLQKARRIHEETALSTEFPWLGRRIDLAVLTKSNRTVAYELKLENNFKAIEQASRNALAFDRSYAVTATLPTPLALEYAQMMGVGVYYLRPHSLKALLSPSALGPVDQRLRARLIAKLRQRTSAFEEVAHV